MGHVMLDSGRGKRRLERSRGEGFLKGVFENEGVSGASMTTPSNSRLLREFQGRRLQGSTHSRVA